MGALVFFSSFVFGAIVGSFLNVVILRLNTGLGLGGRSFCPSCGKKLRRDELVPVVSFLIQRGRCRGCGSKISWQYPLVELLTAALFALAGATLFSGMPSVAFLGDLTYHFIILSLVVLIGVYDTRHKIIPNEFVYPFVILSAVPVFFSFTHGFFVPDIWHIFAAPILALPLTLLWFVSKGTWIGLADSKLVWGFGWLLGLSKGVTALMFGFWIGAIVGILLLIFHHVRLFGRGRALTMKSEVPFGPFLIAGFLLVYFFNIDLFALLL